ncbi:hypothetical protein CEXT_504591 [Caerostris extrusa]|uniref:Uncharacterized protein n=1 Tax=Caerostris extrusa TaxID=172846 RepID=A0AAV4UMN0_CAEEX|nr:hypothetical protein CEXT_504591 [Caerostris extrusa]
MQSMLQNSELRCADARFPPGPPSICFVTGNTHPTWVVKGQVLIRHLSSLELGRWLQTVVCVPITNDVWTQFRAFFALCIFDEYDSPKDNRFVYSVTRSALSE